MKIKELKKIIDQIGTEGLINEFILNKDGTVKAVDPSRTLLVDLKYNGIILQDNIGFENSRKLKGIINAFPDDTEPIITEKIVLKASGIEAEIPRRAIDTITKPLDYPNIPFQLEINEVSLEKLRKAVKNRTEDLAEQYVFETKNGMLRLIVGNQETGWIGEDIASAPTDKNLTSKFTVNIPEVIKTLEKNPTIKIGHNLPIEFSYSTDSYSIKYLAAPRNDTT